MAAGFAHIERRTHENAPDALARTSGAALFNLATPGFLWRVSMTVFRYLAGLYAAIKAENAELGREIERLRAKAATSCEWEAGMILVGHSSVGSHLG